MITAMASRIRLSRAAPTRPRVSGRTVTSAALAAVMGLGLTGCSWRIETPEPTYPPATETEIARDAAALALAQVAAALEPGALPGEAPGTAYARAFEERAIVAQLDALGGVYVAYADTSPDAEPSPSMPPLPSHPQLGYSVIRARDTTLAGALTLDDPSLARLLGSIGLSQAVAAAMTAHLNAEAAGGAPARVAERTLPPAGGFTLDSVLPGADSLAALDPEALRAMIIAHDHAAFVYDVIAARDGGEGRAASLARGRLHWLRANALVALAKAQASEAEPREPLDDPRAPAYVIDPAALADVDAQYALAREIELNIATTYMAAFGDAVESGDQPKARGWLLSAAFDATMASATWFNATAEEHSVFPGVSVGE